VTDETAENSKSARAAGPAGVSKGHADPAVGSALARLRRWPSQVKMAYADGNDRPLNGYLGLLTVYASGTLASVAVGKLSGRRLPTRIGGGDLLLIGVATHKLSRMIAKDPVLSPFRAPFTTYTGQSGEAELAEEVRGRGFQHAVGELLTCPFCLAQWVATAFTAGLVLAPRATRLAAAALTAKAISDTAQLVYDSMEKVNSAAPSS
jgi:hypothetical protein